MLLFLITPVGLIYFNFTAKENINLLTEEEQQIALNKINDKVMARIKNETYNWKELDFNLYESVVYMAARLPANYASLLHIFNEVI